MAISGLAHVGVILQASSTLCAVFTAARNVPIDRTEESMFFLCGFLASLKELVELFCRRWFGERKYGSSMVPLCYFVFPRCKEAVF